MDPNLWNSVAYAFGIFFSGEWPERFGNTSPDYSQFINQSVGKDLLETLSEYEKEIEAEAVQMMKEA